MSSLKLKNIFLGVFLFLPIASNCQEPGIQQIDTLSQISGIKKSTPIIAPYTILAETSFFVVVANSIWEENFNISHVS